MATSPEYESPHLRPEKPHGTRFQQQKLPHFAPEHSTPAVVVCLFVVAVIFLPLGSAIIVASDAVFELDLDYGKLKQCTVKKNEARATFSAGGATSTQGCRTRVNFTLSKTLTAPIQLMYRVVNFHQNYRPFARSKNDDQLQGYSVKRADAETCAPMLGPDQQGAVNSFTYSSGVTVPYGEMIYHPCGAVPWSMFNDSFVLYKVPSAASVTDAGPLPSGSTLICNGSAFNAAGDALNASLPCKKKGIALSADSKSRFLAPPAGNRLWTNAGVSTSADAYLAAGYYFGEPGHKVPSVTDEDFMVWSRLAGIADFVKPYRIITSDLVPGDYVVEVNEFWDAAGFSGEKHVVLTTTSWIGGKNYVLGIAYVVMGSLAFIFAAGFLVHYLLSDDKRAHA